MTSTLRSSLVLASGVVALLLTGCGTGLNGSAGLPGTPAAAVHLGGSVHGGQQPVFGATIQLYAVSTAGYGAAASPLIGSVVKTSSTGAFDITNLYDCTGVDQVYITATGGNPGIGSSNAALALMAALGSCSTLKANAATTFINMNEVTTVAAAWSLSRFMTSPTQAGTSSTNHAGLVNAFAAVNKIVDLKSGTVPGLALPAGATLPVAEINTLADILATCVNSTGSTAPGMPCGTLFTAAKAQDGTVPTDTITAAINIANNPAANISMLYGLAAANPPFQPTLNTAPANWLIGIRYVGGGLSTPSSLAVDSSGNVWLANKGNNSVTELASTGAAISPAAGYTGGSLSSPSGIAADASGNVWVANAGGNSVTHIQANPLSLQNYTGGGMNQPSSIAVDGTGNVWVANQGNSSLTELSNSGSVLSSTSGITGAGINQPVGVVINAR